MGKWPHFPSSSKEENVLPQGEQLYKISWKPRHFRKEKRDSINNYSRTTGVTQSCPGRNRTCGRIKFVVPPAPWMQSLCVPQYHVPLTVSLPYSILTRSLFLAAPCFDSSPLYARLIEKLVPPLHFFFSFCIYRILDSSFTSILMLL